MTNSPTTGFGDWNRTEKIALAMAALAGGLEAVDGLLHGFGHRSVAILLACSALASMTAYGRYHRAMHERGQTFGGGD